MQSRPIQHTAGTSSADRKSVDDIADDMVILGRVSGVYGIKGWLKIYSYTEPREAIITYSPWYIRPAHKQIGWKQVTPLQGKRHTKTVIVQFDGCDDRNMAQLYTGYEIAVTPSQLQPLDGTNEFYWRDLIGLSVVNLQGITLGKVESLIETGANDVLVVSTGDKKQETLREYLIPWTFEYTVISVDLAQSLIKVDWQESWYDKVSAGNRI